MKISANYIMGVFTGLLALGTLLAGCGRNSNYVTKPPAPSVGRPPAVKSMADLRQLLVPGMATNDIVRRLGTPESILPWGEGTVRWEYGFTPFASDDEILGTVVGVHLAITNGHLAGGECVYSSMRWQGSAGPAMTIPGNRATASSTEEPPLLKCFIVSSNQIAGGRFIDTDQFPKLGFIPPVPGLVIKTLKEVWLQEHRPNPGAGNPNQKIWALNFQLTETDAPRFESFTENNVDNKLLIMVGDEPIFSALIREPIPGGRFEITTTNLLVVEEAKKLLASMPRKE